MNRLISRCEWNVALSPLFRRMITPVTPNFDPDDTLTSRDNNRWSATYFLAAIAAVAFGLRAYHLGRLSFWYDEVVTMRLAGAGGPGWRSSNDSSRSTPLARRSTRSSSNSGPERSACRKSPGADSASSAAWRPSY